MLKIEGVDLELDNGEILIVFGPKNSGKTKFLEGYKNKKGVLLLDEPKIIDKETKRIIKEGINKVIITTRTGDVLNFIKAKKACVLIDGKIMCVNMARDIIKVINADGYKKCTQCKCYDRKCNIK